MSKHLARDLDDLQRRVLEMAGRVEEAVYQSVQSLKDRDVELARKVIDGDTAIDRLENGIYEECLKILALHQPVAIDLRRITSMFMVNTDLERMGDLAVDIAERTEALDTLGVVPPIPDTLLRMTDLTTGMVREALDSFVNLDTRQARRVIRQDDEVDRQQTEIIEELMEEMRASPEMVEGALSLFSATRHLERIADHATNIAEDVVYLVDGEMIRHRPESAAQ